MFCIFLKKGRNKTYSQTLSEYKQLKLSCDNQTEDRETYVIPVRCQDQ